MKSSVRGDIDGILAGIERLPGEWHRVGSVSVAVLRGLARHLRDRAVRHSLETGSGKTTLLFSHLSEHHQVFALNDYDGYDTQSISHVRASPLFNAATVEFVEGPTQLTLPRHRFQFPVDAALIDGPHAYPFPELEYYYVYPQLATGALLVVDDIHIPTVTRLYDFIREDEMFSLVEVIGTTAFFRRTSAPTFSPVLDGWWLQAYNKKRFSPPDDGRGPARSWPRRAFAALKRLLRR